MHVRVCIFLRRDQITVEYCCRIRSLVRLILHDGFRPDIVYFCGGVRVDVEYFDEEAMQQNEVNAGAYPNNVDDRAKFKAVDDGASSSKNRNKKKNKRERTTGHDLNLINSSKIGYIYFRHLCESLKVNVTGIEFVLEGDLEEEWVCDGESGGINHIVDIIQSRMDDDEREMLGDFLHYHFVLISCEYHLGNINDVHRRSPLQVSCVKWGFSSCVNRINLHRRVPLFFAVERSPASRKTGRGWGREGRWAESIE